MKSVRTGTREKQCTCEHADYPLFHFASQAILGGLARCALRRTNEMKEICWHNRGFQSLSK